MAPTDRQPKQLKDDPAQDRLGRKSERMDEFVSLLGQNERRLFVYLKSRMPCSNDADDLLQETNLLLWREFDSFELGTNFTAWAYRIAENQVRAARKRQQRDRLVFSEAFLEAVSKELSAESEQLERRSVALGDCLQRLPPHHRELIERRYTSGDAVDRLAEHLSKSPDAVYRILSRIRRTLHDCVTTSLAKGEF
jgi:RNA polymerase sigma-70 factor (ECF subfamily)